MPFCPGIPNDQVVPTMCPGNHKQAQGIVIVDVHSIVINTGMDVSTAVGPFGQATFGVWHSQDYRIKGVPIFRRRCGH